MKNNSKMNNWSKAKINYLKKVNKINGLTYRWLKSNLFVYLTISVFSIVSSIQLTLYGIGVIDNSNIGLRPNNGGIEASIWFGWVHLSFQAMAGIASIILHIKIQNRDNNWIWYSVASTIFYLFNAIILRIWFSSLSLIIMLCIRIYQNKYWKKNTTINNISKTKWWFNLLIILGTIILSFLFGFLMDLIPKDSSFKNNTPYLDASMFIFLMTTQFFLIKKNIFVHMINIPMIILNLSLVGIYGQWMTFSKTLITLITVIFGMISWQSDYYNQIKNKLNS